MHRRKTWPVCQVNWAACAQCGATFIARWGKKYCSGECIEEQLRRHREEYRPKENAKKREAYVPGPPKPCPVCGELTDSYGRLHDECRRQQLREHKRRAKTRRRIRKAGTLRERYTLKEIAARDGYRCGICNHKIDMQLKAPHPESPSIDHILALANGGDDTKANVQLAHFLCNARKGARGQQQLRLVG